MIAHLGTSILMGT